MHKKISRVTRARRARTPVVDVVGVGLNATDTLLEIPRFPSAEGKVEVIASHVLAGGQVATAMQACAVWGLRARYVGKIGDDAAAALQRAELKRAGIEAHWAIAPGGESQRSWILVDRSTGERTVLWKRDAKLELKPRELRRQWIAQARILLVDGHDTAAATLAARWAREERIPVIADIDNLYPGVEALLEYADYVIGSREFPARITGDRSLLSALPKIAKRFGCKVVGATLGKDGALACDGESFHYSPAYKVESVDTTGAGDVFHGVMVYSVLESWPIPRMLDFCCAAAALNCTALGARGGIRPLREIEKLVTRDFRREPLFSLRKFSLAESLKMRMPLEVKLEGERGAP